MSGFQIFNVVCAILFVLFWGYTMWKGEAFLALPLWKRLLIAGAVVAFMLAWILYDHIHLGT